MKSFIRVIAVTVLAILTIWPMRGAESWSVPGSTPSQVFASGSGSSSDPYIINTAQQLANFAYMVYECKDYYEGKYIALGCDIVLNYNVMANPSSAKAWMPIGSYGWFKDGKFLGTFDGRGHTISGLYISKSSKFDTYVGLFGTLKSNGTIKNLNVKDAVIDLSSSTEDGLYVGGIVGYITDDASVSDCSFEGNIYGNKATTYQGGIVGLHKGIKNITSCRFSGKLGANPSDNAYCPVYVGGIVGYSTGSVYDCSTAVNICGSLNISDGYIGGIGGCVNAYIVNCTTAATDANGNSCLIKGINSKTVGGIAGWASVLSHCRNYATVQTDHASFSMGGVAGSCSKVEYTANFGRVYCVDEGYTRSVVDVYMGGVVGRAYIEVKNCANYGAVDVPDMQWKTDHGADYVYTHCGGIAGDSPAITCSFNVGTVKASSFNYQGSWTNHSFGVSRNLPDKDDRENTYFLNTTSAQATASGDYNMKAELLFFQGEVFQQTYESIWGMKWGIDPATKLPLPIKWGGVSREYALHDIEGEGTEANPFIIDSEEKFLAISDNLKYAEANLDGKYYKQVCDLDFESKDFTPIGMYIDEVTGNYSFVSFKGHYDGGGYTVRNINYTFPGNGYVGVFAKLEDGGSLSNINFSCVNFVVSDNCTAGIAVGSYNTTCEPDTEIEATGPKYTPLSGINVLACSIVSHGKSHVGGLVGSVSTNVHLEGRDTPYTMNTANITIDGCTVQNTSIEASYIAGGLVGLQNYTLVKRSTAMCNFSVNDTHSGPCYIGGLLGANFCYEAGSEEISRETVVHNCVALPAIDYDSVDKMTQKCYIGGFLGNAGTDPYSEMTINNSMADLAGYNGSNENVFVGYCVGYDNEATYEFSFAEFPDAKLCGNLNNEELNIIVDPEYKTLADLGGWDAYYLNGNSNEGNMKWGYYYPTATPNPYAVTSANGKYSYYTLKNASMITAPDKLYVDFTLPAVPLDNNVVTAAEGTSISQILVAAKANLVSQNGVASRLYLHDKMDFKYTGSFQTYAVHFENTDEAKCQVLCLPFEVRQEMLPEGSLMLAIDGYTASAVTSKVITTAAAGTPFILYNANGVVIDYDSYDGIVTGSTTADPYLSGTFAATTAAAGDYVLSADGSKFVRLTASQSVAAFRGYVPAAKFPGAGDEVPFIIEADKFADLTTAGAVYQLNFTLYGVRVHDGVLYATTAKQSADISKPIEGLPMEEFESKYWYDNDQFDWIAIPDLGEDYVGKALSTGFVAQYTGDQLASAANYSIAGAAPSINLSTYTSAHILHGNYTNYADDDYHGFFVAPKTNEVARFYGYVTTEIDGVRYLTLEKEWCGLLNGKGVVIEGNSETMPDRTYGYQAFEGILVADAAANGGRKILFTEYKGEVTSELDPATATERIYSVDGAVVIEASTAGLATIYTPAGAVVAQQPVTAGHQVVVPLPAGLYIATLPTTATRVVVH